VKYLISIALIVFSPTLLTAQVPPQLLPRHAPSHRDADRAREILPSERCDERGSCRKDMPAIGRTASLAYDSLGCDALNAHSTPNTGTMGTVVGLGLGVVLLVPSARPIPESRLVGLGVASWLLPFDLTERFLKGSGTCQAFRLDRQSEKRAGSSNW
jgi:hypothetical protein